MAKPMEVLIAAERVILDEAATPDQIRAAVASVDALKMQDFSKAIRRTLGHHARHSPE